MTAPAAGPIPASFLPDAEGWVPAARRVPSPNFDERPAGMPVDLVVLHNISLPPGQFGSGDIEAFFQNRLDPDRHPFFATIHQVQVSAHFLVRRDGELVQFVPCTKRAWHAGQSDFFGRSRCNDFSVGIEIEGTDDLPFTAAQYTTTSTLVKALRATLPVRAVAGHSDIAPGRKTDPGPHFDWDRFAGLAGVPQNLLPYRPSHN
ncbi:MULTISPECIES: 1,6-anhydro-N-acetylmuramyl-L-alanine amidase AmpD [Cupriavidus]|uniref:1,6-anhydro-N-acetylmuramyl-L-alanine amidase AmpD n=1 Tax=Cupriavidus pinatubonensis (strain JMP 134 / LMG 1197) TaxID=264198 RepID=Q46X31_CUPPJ|nr:MULTISPECIES: 1,6-anhydro-N-acetylmuramyl-L-alanine amidase AmpD [Cupriavidus]TPQ31371.1 1,6-anhydro-N-acetylmuramyl-L-alanine amidase AmpD [Cupriavidus pinatubonensis]